MPEVGSTIIVVGVLSVVVFIVEAHRPVLISLDAPVVIVVSLLEQAPLSVVVAYTRLVDTDLASVTLLLDEVGLPGGGLQHSQSRNH
jgi:hypothetical protein